MQRAGRCRAGPEWHAAGGELEAYLGTTNQPLGAHLDCQVLIHEEVRGLQVAVDDGRLAGVQEVLQGAAGGAWCDEMSGWPTGKARGGR